MRLHICGVRIVRSIVGGPHDALRPEWDQSDATTGVMERLCSLRTSPCRWPEMSAGSSRSGDSGQPRKSPQCQVNAPVRVWLRLDAQSVM